MPRLENHPQRLAAGGRRRASRERGVAAVLAMMFLVIFGSLAAAMAIVSQGNLQTAQSHLKINRTLAAAESGLALMSFHMADITRFDGDTDGRPDLTTTDGLIEAERAYQLWNATDGVRDQLIDRFTGNTHNIEAPNAFSMGAGPDGREHRPLIIGPIRVGPGEPDFVARFDQHPIPGEDYNDPMYSRPPYDGSMPDETGIATPVSNANPLDARFVRVRVVAFDDGASGKGFDPDNAAYGSYQGAESSPEHARVYRSVQQDFRITKRIPYALLSRSRVMIGRNVMVDGPIGSHFQEVGLSNGHPVQSVSDFRGLDAGLDAQLDALIGTLISNDINGDNRLNIRSASETAGIADPASLDLDGDGYISDFDFVLEAFDDSPADGRISKLEFGVSGDETKEQLFDLINEMSPLYDPDNPTSGDNMDYLDSDDFYAKIRGSVSVLANKQNWENGAANGNYQDYLQGPIQPDFGDPAVTFDDTSQADAYKFEPQDFNIASFAEKATATIDEQAAAPVPNDPNQPATFEPPSEDTREGVPYGSKFPYDFYERPVYRNMVFENARIPKGSNARFENCRFIGVTYIETSPLNADPMFNYIGMQNADGSFKHPDKSIEVDGVELGGNEPDVGKQQALGTKNISNNVRFHNCVFEGAVVSGSWTTGSATSEQPMQYTHVRNKVAFTGTTKFEIEDSNELTAAEKKLYERSTLLLPHFSVEMGSFDEAYDPNETVELSGTIVAGLIDLRGQVDVNGTVVTTFEPMSGQGPVIGATSPQFNTTLGYFDQAAGDLEGAIPDQGLGKIKLRYDPSIPLPDGIDGPITLLPLQSTLTEGGRW